MVAGVGFGSASVGLLLQGLFCRSLPEIVLVVAEVRGAGDEGSWVARAGVVVADREEEKGERKLRVCWF